MITQPHPFQFDGGDLRMRQLDLREHVGFYDQNARLVSSSQDAQGITAEVTGSWFSQDPGDWPRWTFRLRDVLRGERLPPSCFMSVHFWMRERTAPGTSSDLTWLVGLQSETQQDLSQADANGQFVGMIWNGGNRRPHAVSVAAGVATYNGTGLANASCRGVDGMLICGGEHRRQYSRFAVAGHDANDAYLVTYTGTAGTYLDYGADPYLSLAIGRWSNVVGNETAKVDIWYAVQPVVLQ